MDVVNDARLVIGPELKPSESLNVAQARANRHGASMTWALDTLPEVMRAIAWIGEIARHEMLTCDDPSLAGGHAKKPRPYAELWQELDTSLLGRGVVVRQLMSAAGYDLDDEAEGVARLGDLGRETRLVDEPIPRLVLVDQKVAILARDGISLAAGALVSRDPAVVRALAAGFGPLWTRSSSPLVGGGLSDDLAQVLAMLMSGVTNDTGRRRLGISLRTYHRRVAELLSLLGVSSRFQAGAAAMERGWLNRQSRV